MTLRIEGNKDYEKEIDQRIIKLGLSEYYEIWEDITSRLNIGERIQFSIYIKLKQIDGEFRNLSTEFNELNKHRIDTGEALPINIRTFLQIFAEEEQWTKPMHELSISGDDHYFNLMNRASSFIRGLIKGKRSESNIMETVKEIYQSEKYKEFLDELKLRYDKAKLLPAGKTSHELIIEKHLGHLNGKNLGDIQIMKPAEYKRMIKYANEFFPDFKIPPSMSPIPKTAISDNHLWYPFYEIYYEFHPSRKFYPKELFYFIGHLFKQIEWREDYDNLALYKKFGKKPDNYSTLKQNNK